MKHKPTNWTAIAAIGQLLSAVAVALTLIYLTMQIRHAEIAASDANRLARAQGVVNFWLEAAHDPAFRKTALSVNKPNQPWIEEIARRLEITSEEASQLQASTL
jgi:heme/copper-type cytochrome/quinol oxidase subunit 1